METNRAEEPHGHVHRTHFMGRNTFSEPWHLPHSPPEQLKEIVYEGAFIRFVDEINLLATYQWWEGSVYSILSVIAYPLAWSWLQWRRRMKLQRLSEFIRSEYDHACLRSCRSRALYEGIKDFVGLVISILLPGDFSLVLLTLLQLYSVSMADVFLVLFILPLGILLPFPAGINALFSHGSRQSSGLACLYALWNITSVVNVVVAFICGCHFKSQPSRSKPSPFLQPWGI